MNISTETIKELEKEYVFFFYDNFMNEVKPEDATELHIVFRKSDFEMIHKNIKETKKETTYEYIMNKINSDVIYKNFSEYFNKLIKKYNFASYPTTYGIGVFVAVGFRKSIEKTKSDIENELNKLGIKFTTEYSDAMYVFRYKISKSKENIQKIENLLKNT